LRLDEILAAFNFSSLQECETILKLLNQKEIPVEDFYVFVADARLAILKNKLSSEDCKPKTISKYMPRCPSCRETLTLMESEEDFYESKWVCRCGYEYYTQLSIVDQRMLIDAKINGTDPDFEVEELRASLEERKRRRSICETCDQLMPSKTCKACGCRMKHRTYYEILTCPKKFW